jgi:Tfp pilus assembly protein PilX
MKKNALKGHRGMALPVALILLIAAALIAAASAQSTQWNTRANNGLNDRARALFQAESIVKQAEAEIDNLMGAAGDDIPAAVRARSNGFMVRGDQGVPSGWDPWPAGGIQASTFNNDGTATYFVVYEGQIVHDSETGLSGSSGATDLDNAVLHRFTIVTRSGGRQEGTQVVLQVVRQY